VHSDSSQRTPKWRAWRNARLATMVGPGMGIVDRGAVLTHGDTIVFAGHEADLPDPPPDCESIDLGARLVTPALVDCHTHLVHGGSRAGEFEMRLEGASYADIARAGGGILSTVAATRALTVEQMVAGALPRLDPLLLEGVSTVEIKSGYGLLIDAELNMLRAARTLAAERPVRVATSWLAAHALPPEYSGRGADYLDNIVLPGLARAHALGLVDAVDAFCETIAFSPAEVARVFDAARSLGLPVKIHAEQLSNQGGARLAAAYGALSADHLEHVDAASAAAMARAGTVAVLLPGAFYTLRETQRPDVASLRAHGVPIAVATDCNPGSSPLTSILLALNMAATLFGLTIAECLVGATRVAAQALGLAKVTGTLEAGKSADLAVWNAEAPAELVYRMGFNPLHARVFRGERVHP
jgi:imidazolonepropionase